MGKNSSTVPAYLWDRDPELDDALHNYDPKRDGTLTSFTCFSGRGWMNMFALFILIVGLILLFTSYPIILFYRSHILHITGWNLGGINGTGQVPDLPNMPTLIDKDTPKDAQKRTGWDGEKYRLVFSDEFNQDGRTFWPGDDPFWEAPDMHYWPTGNIEWYNPAAVTTEDGKLVITMEQMAIQNLNFRSGMIASWNKFCFTTGYIEVSISLPGSADAAGFWPAAWTLGNLGRAGYGATTEGTWPYSYDSCDIGTFPNQSNPDLTPEGAVNGGNGGGPLSFLPGQKLSACTCPGSSHPGPTVSTGRGAPEIDILEAEIDVERWVGRSSQSLQLAPYNYRYRYNNETPATTVHDTSTTHLNEYTGGPYQQAVSALTDIGTEPYGGNAYSPYAYEYWADPKKREDGYITWFTDGKPTWTVTSDSLVGDEYTTISSRIIPEEPMYIILNFGMAPSFQRQDWSRLKFPAKMYVDYVRVYQREGTYEVSCNPANRPTAEYIEEHLNAYSNPNYTTWAQAGYGFPRNERYEGCS